MYVGLAAKHSHVTEVWLLAEHELPRSLSPRLCWRTVTHVVGRDHGFCPKVHTELGLMKHCSASVEQSSINSFRRTILLRGVGSRLLVLNAVGVEVLLQTA